MHKKNILVAFAAVLMLAPSVMAAETEYNTPDDEGVELVIHVDAPEEVYVESHFFVTISGYTGVYNASVSIESSLNWMMSGCEVIGDEERVNSAYASSLTVELKAVARACNFAVKVTANHDDWRVDGVVSESVRALPIIQEVQGDWLIDGQLDVYNEVMVLGDGSAEPEGEVVIPEDEGGVSALQIVAYVLFGLVLLGGVGWFIYNRVNGGYDDFEDSLEVPVAPVPAPAPQPAPPAPVMPPAAPTPPPAAPEGEKEE